MWLGFFCGVGKKELYRIKRIYRESNVSSKAYIFRSNLSGKHYSAHHYSPNPFGKASLLYYLEKIETPRAVSTILQIISS